MKAELDLDNVTTILAHLTSVMSSKMLLSLYRNVLERGCIVLNLINIS